MHEITEERIIYLLKKYKDFFLADIDKNLCLEHYNWLHRINLTENDLSLNSSECWLCKQIKDRP